MPGLTGDPGEFDDALAIANAGRYGQAGGDRITDAAPPATDAAPRAADAAPRATDAAPRATDAAPRATDAAPRTPDTPPQAGADPQGAASQDAAPRGTPSRTGERSSERTWIDPWHAPWGNGHRAARSEAAAAEDPAPGPGDPPPSYSPEPPPEPTASEPTASEPTASEPAAPQPVASASRKGSPSSPTPRPGAHSPWHVARVAAAGAVAGPLEAGAVPLGTEALGRVLAGALTALTDLPSFDTSAMDGWAVSGPGPWRVTAPRTVAPAASAGILAGHAPARPLPDGHAIRIATGARIPPGASAVLRSEHGETAEQADGGALLSAPGGAPPGQDIRPRGQECRNGDQLLPPGALVTPAVLGLAAAAGYDELWTYRRPMVEILVLGDELLHSGLPQEGRIRDALGPMLAPWLHALGAETIGPRHLADDEGVLYEAIASSTADVVITTGGTAAGPVDHVHPALRRLGAELLVDGVQVRPGHPMLLARLDPTDDNTPADRPARHLVGLPGNPLAAVSGLLTLAEPLLGTLSGRTRSAPRRVRLADGVHGHPHDTRLVPVACRTDEKGAVVARPLHFNGPAMLRGIAAADALAVIPPGGAAEGEPAVLLDLPWSPAATAPDTGATGGRA
ncbi:molybdopterin molybdotransferase MoeA [Streptomyces sp. NPDC000151]|uniref:molybdopterin molybdotransferase MoeA n=1 Tax=Streptomyces sp. NPDC000151 TaxID=3154244 RepID=UPI00331F7382